MPEPERVSVVGGNETQVKALLRVRQAELAARHAQQEAEKSRRRLEAALEIAQLGVWEYDQAAAVTHFDERCREVFGFAGEGPVSNAEVLARIHPADRARVEEQLRGAIGPAATGLYDTKYRVVRPDGTQRWVAVRGHAVKAGVGPGTEIIQFVGTLMDTTERERAEEALRETSERFRFVLEQSGDVAYRRDLQRDRYDYLSPVAATVLGFPVEEMNGMGIKEALSHIHPEDRAFAESALAKAAQTGSSGKLEYRWQRKDGEWRWLADDVTVTLDPAGRPLYCSGFVRDITGRKRAEEDRRAREAMLDAFFTASPGILNLFDQELRFLDADSVTASYFGLDRKRLIGKSVADLNPVFVEQVLGPMLQRVTQTGQPVLDVEVAGPVPSRQGAVGYFRVSYFPVPLPGGQKGLGVVGVEITAMKLAEEALRQSEQKYRGLFESMSEGFAMGEPLCRPDGSSYDFQFLEINRAFERQSGLTRDILGKPMRQVLPNLEQHWIDTYSGVAQSGNAAHFEAANQDTGRHYEVFCYSPVQGRFAIIFTDQTERKRTEEALRDSEKRYRSLFESIDEGFCLIELLYDQEGHVTDWRFLEANPAFERHNGLEQAAGRTIRELVPDIEPRWFEVYGQVARTGEAVRLVEFSSAFNRWFDLYAFRVGQSAERKVAVLFNDITERKRTEEALRAQGELLAAILDNIPVLLCIWDAKLQSFRFNKPLRQVLGWTEADAEAGDFMSKVYPDAEYRQEVTLYMLSLKEGWRDLKTTAKDGTQIDISWANIRLSDGTSIGIGIDVRERIRREQALRIAEEQLARHAEHLEKTVQERTARLSETVADLEQFSYSLAHDLRAPLRTMNCFSTMVLEDLQPTLRGEPLDYLKRIASAAKRMDELICDVLAFARIARAETSPARVDLDRLVKDIIDQYPHLQPQQAEIEVASPLLPLQGNLAMLTQCISNLLGNAVKFVAPGVKPKVRVWTEARNRQVRVFVRDNGIGIESDQIEKIWRIFERAHHQNEYPGTGIGLSIVKRAAERMGGTVGVDSAPAEGSTFWLELPGA